MRWWKWLGLAGLVGAAAVGAVAIQRHRTRRWREYEPDDLRARLHQRLDGSTTARAATPGEERGTGWRR